MSGWPRIIIHGDMDAFFAAVEQLDHPELRGKAVLIGGTGRRGVVSTASYEARPFGCHSAMPMAVARRLCPQAVVLAPNLERYKEISGKIMAVFSTYSPLVEPLSLDEAFVDMSGAEGLFGPPEQIAANIKRDVLEATGGLTISVGVATTKFVAKVASDYRKPDGLTVVKPGAEREFLWPLPVKRLWGVGPEGQKRLQALGLATIGDVARSSPELLRRRLGSLGDHIYVLAHNRDEREVVPYRDAKSIGAEYTLETDVVGKADIMRHLRRSADRIARSLRGKSLAAGGVRVKLKTAEFKLLTRQSNLRRPTDSAPELLATAENLLGQFDLTQPMRLVGLAAFKLQNSDGPVQGELFVDQKRERQRRLDRTIDELKEKFGDDVLKRGDGV